MQHVYGISLTQDNAAALRYPSAPPEEGAPKTYGSFETINDGEWVRIILAWDGEELSLAYADATGLPGDELERATREEPRPTPTPTPRHTSLEDTLVTP
ncbi:hypothetical protein [Microbacterium sp. 77mftsu3.1]|uniref:hypothetical protein n=1 Tax=Microbacterium sp. 77mftsu3.1 TaxID=1761802 RepID=UPI00115FA805|nr:hypothetical protein [Microbacterium sp. 77mftsu3.1]